MFKLLTIANTFALDSLLVALLWQQYLAHTLETTLSASHRLILAGALILTYLADRLLDSISIPTFKIITQRHAFFKKHQHACARVVLISFPILLVYAFFVLSSAHFWSGIGITALVGLYTFLSARHPNLRLLPKEFQVSTIFTLAILLFLTPQANLIAYGFPLFLILSSNAIFIAHYDMPTDYHQNQSSIARTHPNSYSFALLLSSASLLIGIYIHSIPIALASLLLLALHFLPNSIPRETKRLLPDYALIIPPLLVNIL